MAELSKFANDIFKRTYAFTPDETWEQCAYRVAKAVANTPKQEANFFQIIRDRQFMPGGRYLYSAGRPIFQNANCFGYVAKDSREGWAELLHDTTMCLSMGGGVGISYSEIRPSGSLVGRMGGTSSGPIALMQIVNEASRFIQQGGRRRAALWAGLNWNHPDINTFINIKDWNDDVRTMKSRNYEYPAPLDLTNISVVIGDEYLSKLQYDANVQKLHFEICDRMARTGEPAFRNQSLILKDDPDAVTGNPCQEAVLHDGDSCNLGSVVLPRINDTNHLEFVVRNAMQFLINGSAKADYPTEKIAQTVKRNRRVGLGIMGLHEFVMVNHARYDVNTKLQESLKTWKDVSDNEAKTYASALGINTPITKRAVAPTGTISILAETTSGIEPVFCIAYKRRYLNGDKHSYQYVVDPTARRLLNQGVPAETIEDAYSLSSDFTRRLRVQAFVQQYTDQAISSTVNLPIYGSKGNNDTKYIADTLAEYLPVLKGITLYPDNSRSGQPLTPVSLDEALSQEGTVFEEDGDCRGGVCGL